MNYGINDAYFVMACCVICYLCMRLIMCMWRFCGEASECGHGADVRFVCICAALLSYGCLFCLGRGISDENKAITYILVWNVCFL